MWWDGKTWRDASEVNSDSEDQLQKDVREILIGQYLGSNVEEYLGLNDSNLQKEILLDESTVGRYARIRCNSDGTCGIVLLEHHEDVSKEHNLPIFKQANDFDPVEKPAHYNQGGIEAIDYIKQQLGDEGYRAYCLGNVMKYLHRHAYKGKPKEDLAKAVWYLNEAKGTY